MIILPIVRINQTNQESKEQSRKKREEVLKEKLRKKDKFLKELGDKL